jgi:hypothetical protein
MEGSRTPVEESEAPKVRFVVLTETECLDGIQALAGVLAGNDPAEQLRRPYLRGSLSTLLANLRGAYASLQTQPEQEEEEEEKSSPKGKKK